MANHRLENKVFLALLLLVSIAFLWILLPFYGAVFWAVILAIIFAPLQRRLTRRMPGRPNLTATITLFAALLIAVLPVGIIGTLLVQEGANLYQRIESGQLDLGAYLEWIRERLPPSLQQQLNRLGIGDFQDLREQLSGLLMQGSQFLATRAFSFGQSTFEFLVRLAVMLYLLFFLIRDGSAMVARVRNALPLADVQKHRLFTKFTQVVRATVKGNLVVAITQGTLGGLIFWFLGIPSVLLWAVVMTFLSLLPAVGAALIWTPVAIYYLLSGQIWQGVLLTLYGVGVIGLVDNVLRPILVGKDTKLPDYMVLISTLGGLALFGLNGFVIGPLVAALFMSTWGLFTEREEVADDDHRPAA
jgi:predicted PurR-regulated permease PerM